MRRRLVEREILGVVDNGETVEVIVEVLGPSDRQETAADKHDALSIYWGRDDLEPAGIWIDAEEIKSILEEAEGVKISIASLENVDPKTLMRRRRS